MHHKGLRFFFLERGGENKFFWVRGGYGFFFFYFESWVNFLCHD